MLVGDGIYLFLEEGASTEDQAAGLCIIGLKRELFLKNLTLMTSINREVPSNATYGKLLINLRKSYMMVMNFIRLMRTLYSESGVESTSFIVDISV